jgi:hypothetical protein
MPVAGSTRACSSGVQAARRSPLAPVRVEQAADDVRPAYRQQDVLLSRNACMFMCVHAGGRADYRGHVAMCSCMFVCMLCMAAVTNHDTQSRRTGLPVPDTSRWRRGADGCSCGRDRDFHVQVLSRCRCWGSWSSEASPSSGHAGDLRSAYGFGLVGKPSLYGR